MLHVRKSRGFTLMELMIVIVIVGILAAAGSMAFAGVLNGGREKEAKDFLGGIGGQVNAYMATHPTFDYPDFLLWSNHRTTFDYYQTPGTTDFGISDYGPNVNDEIRMISVDTGAASNMKAIYKDPGNGVQWVIEPY